MPCLPCAPRRPLAALLLALAAGLGLGACATPNLDDAANRAFLERGRTPPVHLTKARTWVGQESVEGLPKVELHGIGRDRARRALDAFMAERHMHPVQTPESQALGEDAITYEIPSDLRAPASPTFLHQPSTSHRERVRVRLTEINTGMQLRAVPGYIDTRREDEPFVSLAYTPGAMALQHDLGRMKDRLEAEARAASGPHAGPLAATDEAATGTPRPPTRPAPRAGAAGSHAPGAAPASGPTVRHRDGPTTWRSTARTLSDECIFSWERRNPGANPGRGEKIFGTVWPEDPFHAGGAAGVIRTLPDCPPGATPTYRGSRYSWRAR